MAISAGTVGNVRADGSDGNGGLFYSAQTGAGTDYSLQAAAQLSLADVVTDGTTTVTSATGGFTAAMVANGINIAGTSYMIATRVDTNTITVDRTIGAASGQTGKVGGAWGSAGYAWSQLVQGCTLNVQSGTYTNTSGTNNISGGRCTLPVGTSAAPTIMRGYGTVPGDNGAKPVINDGNFVCAPVIATGAFAIVDNIAVVIQNAASICIQPVGAFTRVIRCQASGPGIGFSSGTSGIAWLFCYGTNTTNAPFSLFTNNVVIGCVAKGSSTDGFVMTGGTVFFSDCISASNGGNGYNVNSTGPAVFQNCTARSNTGSGFLVSSGAPNGNSCINCIASQNGAYGYSSTSATAFFALLNCATYLNTSGATHNITNIENAIVLTGSPFIGTTIYGLNGTAGAGAACRAAGLPGVFPGLPTTISYLDIGAVQHLDATVPVLTVVQSGSTAVLTWTATVGAVHYVILRTNTDPTLTTPVWIELAVVSSVTLTYTDSTPSSPSYYTVAATPF